MTSASPDLRISLIQTDLAWQAAELNRQLLEPQLLPMAGQTDLIILPEMFTSAFAMGAGAIAEEHPGPTLVWMQNLASKLDAAITGSIAVTEAGKRYNRLLFVKPDGTFIHYDKRHLFRMLGEDKRYADGSRKVIVEWRGWRILPLICYDLRFPVWCRYTKTEPYDLALFVANWPAARNHHWRTLLQARAIENLAYVAGVNRIGIDGNNLEYVGHSVVVSPQGIETLQAGAEAGVRTTTISMQELSHWREKFPAWMDADEFVLQ
ncbi:MAG: amidohydrolase [Pseudomonadota bacterium]